MPKLTGEKTDSPFSDWLSPFFNAGFANPFQGALGGASPLNATNAAEWMKAIDPSEIDKRIQELRVVELWLQSQIGLVQVSIQGLTLQRQSMEALHTAAKGVERTANSFVPSKQKTTRKRRATTR